jgi:hypothetical protein
MVVYAPVFCGACGEDLAGALGGAGNNITGGKRRSGKTNKGNRWLGEVLNECALGPSPTSAAPTWAPSSGRQLARRIERRGPPRPSATASW